MSYAMIDNNKIYYKVTKYCEDAPWIVLLNGIMSTTSSWVPYQQFFVSKGYNVLCHNYRNQPKSSSFKGITFENHVDDLHKLLEILNIHKPNIIGVSYGGIIGLKYALKYQANMTSLSVIATTHLMTNTLMKTIKAWYDFANFKDPKFFLEGVFPFIYHPRFLEDNERLFEESLKSFQNIDDSFFTGQMDLYNNLLNLEDLSHKLNNIHLPTLIITALDDIITPHELGLDINEKIKSSEIVSIPSAAHGVLMEKAETVKSVLIGFIEKLRSDKDE